MFQFPLETVLRLRKAKLEKAQLALAESRRSEADLVRRLELTRAQREESRLELNRRAVEGLPAQEFLLRHQSLAGLRSKVWRLEEELAGCRKVIDKRLAELIEADRQKKMVERLKEKALEEYKAKEKKLEAKLLDEFSVIGFARAGRMNRGR